VTYKNRPYIILACFAYLFIIALSCEDKKINDCAGVEGGVAQIDSCGLCTGGTTGLLPNYLMDCAGQCEGSTELDSCDVCGGDNSCMGCTDPNASNYDNLASINDGSCKYIQTQFQVEDFSSAENCMGCHPTHYDEWSSSMHAYSMKDPVWLSLQRREHQVHDEIGIELGDFCVQCHSPIASLTDAIIDHNTFSLSDLFALPPQIQEGVTCDVCHTATHIPEPTDIQTDGQLFETTDFKLFTDGTRYGTIDDPVDNNYHTSEYHPGYDRSEFCQNCHNLTVNGVNTEVTQFEWEGTAFQAMGSECQSCHMPTYQGQAAVDGPERENLHRHFFPGVDVRLDITQPNPEHLTAVEALLLDAADIEFFPAVPDTLEEDSALIVQVIVSNNSGHNFPSGTTFIRQLWLEIVGTLDGDTVFSSGLLNSDGDISDFYVDPEEEIDPQLHIFNTVLYDAQGDSGLRNVGAEDMVSLSDYTLPVEGSKTVNYSIELPDDSHGTLDISARLRFRSFPPFLLRMLNLDYEATNLPIFDIDQVTAQSHVQ